MWRAIRVTVIAALLLVAAVSEQAIATTAGNAKHLYGASQ
jgi:hypothetical protein